MRNLLPFAIAVSIALALTWLVAGCSWETERRYRANVYVRGEGELVIRLSDRRGYGCTRHINIDLPWTTYVSLPCRVLLRGVPILTIRHGSKMEVDQSIALPVEVWE